MTSAEKAFTKGAEMAVMGLTLERALDRCPWNTVALRSEFIRGWKSLQPKKDQP